MKEAHKVPETGSHSATKAALVEVTNGDARLVDTAPPMRMEVAIRASQFSERQKFFDE